MDIGQIGYIRRVANDDQAPNRIKELREAIGLSQAELARRANATPSALNKLEKGTRDLDLDWMRRLAPHLNVTPAELLPRDANPLILSQEEREMLARFRSADSRDQAQFMRVAEAMLRDEAA